ncbi:sac3 ganp domain protein [Diplodia corticola]|uniref:Sac3 ganp domain protein n=1 Tax=Diplodia corticola TaxID=236234 RepID=A0A1J9RXK2_9PEZI|nr:sac3 ganp domain protein [Diplodia corticola]OJD37379.1 sac3 ganp domain protein [Diplodia corticola]
MSASVPWRQPPGAAAMNRKPDALHHHTERPLLTRRVAPAPAPAYTAVPARRTFARPEPVSTPPSQPHIAANSAPPKKVEWPPAVREYVQRSFADLSAVPNIGRKDIEETLKRVITEATEANMLYEIDWDKHPLPQEIIVAQRTSAANVANSPWRNQSTPEKNMADANGAFPKKRKSPDANHDADDNSLPPWRRTNKRRLDDRSDPPTSPGVVRSLADRMDKNHITPKGLRDKGLSKYDNDADKIEKRQQRFYSGKSSPRPWNTSRDDSPADANDGPVVGTCQDLEKRYLRLTSAPKPEAVRPPQILEKTLEHLKQKWKKEGNYAYICDQFKSLRQDLTVQHIKNEFTVTVYEIHARIALEKGDLGEYNQCQTQLRALYSQKLGGHPAEFLAYRILYFIYTQNRTDMNEVLADLTPTDKTQPAVKHALDVRSALALGNYHKFFRLYLDTPNMGAYLMDMFIVRERLAALANICKAYKPNINIKFLTDELGFESYQDCVQYLCDHGAQQFLEQKDDGSVIFHTQPQSAALFEQLKAGAFRRVDIKGQI